MSDPARSETSPPAEPTTDDAVDLDPPARRRGKLLSHLLDEDVDLDQVFDRIVASQRDGAVDKEVVKAVLPDPSLGTQDVTLAVLLASVLSEYEDIERLIEGFREQPVVGAAENETVRGADEPGGEIHEAVAVVTEAELADPEALSRALEPLQERDRFEFLFDTAKSALNRLDPYELSRKPPGELVAVLREQGQLETIQALVDFLRSLNAAAESFEALDMPTPHIREYLRHLYLMGNWNEMSRLVGLLEVAVSQLSVPPSSRSTASQTSRTASPPPNPREEPTS